MDETNKTTVIRNAAWLVAWNEATGGHEYRRDCDLAFRGNSIVHVGSGCGGPGYEGPADEVIAGERLMVMPGLVNIHSHPLSEPLGKGFFEDVGNPRLGMSGLFDYMPVYGPDEAGMGVCAEVAYAELLKSGVTTLVDLSVPYPGWLELLAASGLRGIVAPMHRSARWRCDNGHEVTYDWSPDGGEASSRAALEVIDRALNHESGRLGAMVTPAQIDTCTPELLKASHAAARERGVPFQIHAAQSLVEFHEMTRRHGMTPLEWLASLDLLGPGTIVAHCIFIDSHSWIYWGERDDFQRLAASGAAVAHCPNVFVRHGMLLESFARYREAGIPLGLGTDTFPHNMLEEMRLACLLGRVAERRVEGTTTADVFAAATLGGAQALDREDIGRLAPGAKADIVLVDLDAPTMQPLRDPLRSLIFAAAERAVRDVYVDGRQVVRDGEVVTLDLTAALTRLETLRGKAEAEVPAKHWSGRPGHEVAPLALPLAPDG
jgi:cytosine/adenosine deaminase-related metal-dependent hydrolase